MYLTKEEERALDGEYGYSIALAMKILVALGEAFNAQRLIPITSAHISGISYVNIGEEGISFLEKISSIAKVKVHTTINPAAFDLDKWRSMNIPQDIMERQLKIIKLFEKIGVTCSLTCTPYLTCNKPKMGEHIAWGESSAVTFVNTVLGSMTNREGGPSALASALTGKTPFYGLHLREERMPTAEVLINNMPRGSTWYSLLGYYIGLVLKQGIPFIKNIPRAVSVEELKSFSAGLAAASNISMAIIEGITPKGTYEEPKDSLEKIHVDVNDLKEIKEKYSANLDSRDIELVFLGCPHYSLKELEEVVNLLKGKRIKKDTRVWIAISRDIYNEALTKGYIRIIEQSGAKVIRDTCAVVAPLRQIGVRNVVTDSAKAMHYLRLRHRANVMLSSSSEVLRASLTY